MMSAFTRKQTSLSPTPVVNAPFVISRKSFAFNRPRYAGL
jgi:hypothetical protein